MTTTKRPDDRSATRVRVTDDERARIVELVRGGMPRNAVAREVGRSPSTVSAVAQREGLSFDRSEVAAATAARQEDNRDKRSRLQELLLDDALRMREQLWEPALVYNFGGKDNTYEERTLARPDFAGQATIMRAVGVAIDKSVRLAEVDSGRQSADGAASVIVKIGEQVRALVGPYPEEGGGASD